MPELTVVVPTFNEADNLSALVGELTQALDGLDWEVLFVDDDSPDGTADRARALAQHNPRVRCLQRLGRRGLASACIEGMLASSAPCLAVMDGDLQHDPALLRPMLETLRGGETDIVVGSRHLDGGGVGDFSAYRQWVSRVGDRLSRAVLKARLTDPMSGFFMLTRPALMACLRNGVSAIGYKLLVDLFASAPRPLRAAELPYTFRSRVAGHSKLDSKVVLDHLALLTEKLVGRFVPVRFLAFSAVGGLGVGVHLAVLWAVFRGLGLAFVPAQLLATLTAMTFNYVLNNSLTYRDRRLRGWRFLGGWLSFTLACSVGAVANVGIAAYLYQRETFWIASALSGVLVGAVWNYAVTSVYTWRK
ncbi:MAG TPA: dolichol monophosphate mannose synthase [Gammaproteobacteria bacterium]|nr:dolichol monophosphate mannose synthase [Gammaproteobacteria bacterium]MCH78448.1 dolichol monophosphate mannose synthase [Gammaproteobacteria bacterium]